MSKSIQKHIRLHQVHLDILDGIISNRPDISNYAEAVRFLCLSYDGDSHKVESDNQKKLNSIGKEVSILTEIVSEFADIHLKKTGILSGRESTVYTEAKENVEKNIKRNQTQLYAERPIPREKESRPKGFKKNPFDI